MRWGPKYFKLVLPVHTTAFFSSPYYFHLSLPFQDFGLVTAMVLDDPCLDDPHTLAVTSPVTSSVPNQHTDQVGTKLYMSPEQSSGLSYSEKVDIYSLGIIFFELLHPMNTEMERGQTLTALRENNAIPESLRRKKKKESGLLLQMIHHDPAKRPAAEEVRVAVEELESLIEVGKRF